jgi:large subunit ribosomal protein L30
MGQKLKVTLTRSGINRGKRHRQTLRGLGLTRMGKTVELENTNAIRGMIFQVQHLVRVEHVGP